MLVVRSQAGERRKDLRFMSLSPRNPPSFPTQTRAKASPASSSPSIPPSRQVRTHSYKSEMADVVVMRELKGGSSFRMRRGS